MALTDPFQRDQVGRARGSVKRRPVLVAVVAQRRLMAEALQQTIDACPLLRCAGAFGSALCPEVAASDVAVVALGDGSGILVVPATKLASWHGERPEPVTSVQMSWNAEPDELRLLATFVAIEALPFPPPPPSGATGELTPKEVQILGLIADGWTTDEIAAELGSSPHTVRTHVRHIHEKLSVHSRTQAVAAARRLGIRSLRPKAAS